MFKGLSDGGIEGYLKEIGFVKVDTLKTKDSMNRIYFNDLNDYLYCCLIDPFNMNSYVLKDKSLYASLVNDLESKERTGDEDALLSIIYSDGLGVTQNMKKSEDYLLQSLKKQSLGYYPARRIFRFRFPNEIKKLRDSGALSFSYRRNLLSPWQAASFALGTDLPEKAEKRLEYVSKVKGNQVFERWALEEKKRLFSNPEYSTFDPVKASEVLKLGADRGLPFCVLEYSLKLISSDSESEEDREKGLGLIASLTDNPNPVIKNISLNTLGKFFLLESTNKGDDDFVKAVNYFSLSAPEYLCDKGMTCLGYAYLYGIGNCEKNREKSDFWYLNAALQNPKNLDEWLNSSDLYTRVGCEEALRALELLYFLVKDKRLRLRQADLLLNAPTKRNLAKAKKLNDLWKADPNCSKEDTLYLFNTARLQLFTAESEEACDEGVEAMLRTAKKGWPDALAYMGLLCFYGRYPDPFGAEAVRYLTEAMNKDSPLGIVASYSIHVRTLDESVDKSFGLLDNACQKKYPPALLLNTLRISRNDLDQQKEAEDSERGCIDYPYAKRILKKAKDKRGNLLFFVRISSAILDELPEVKMIKKLPVALDMKRFELEQFAQIFDRDKKLSNITLSNDREYISRAYFRDKKDLKMKSLYGMIKVINPKDQDDVKAGVKLVKAGAKSGWSYSNLFMGNLYMSGLGVRKNYRKAFRLYCESMDELSNALYRTAECFWRGKGVEKNLLTAAALYKKLSMQNYAESKLFYGELLILLDRPEEAIDPLEEAYQNGSVKAADVLIILYGALGEKADRSKIEKLVNYCNSKKYPGIGSIKYMTENSDKYKRILPFIQAKLIRCYTAIEDSYKFQEVREFHKDETAISAKLEKRRK